MSICEGHALLGNAVGFAVILRRFACSGLLCLPQQALRLLSNHYLFTRFVSSISFKLMFSIVCLLRKNKVAGVTRLDKVQFVFGVR